MKTFTASVSILALAFAGALTACSDRHADENRAAAGTGTPATTTASSAVGATATTVPPAERDTSPPAPTPSTHAGTPQPEAPPTRTARESAENTPQNGVSKSEETHTLPMPGQTNNYNSPNREGQQDDPPQYGDNKGAGTQGK